MARAIIANSNYKSVDEARAPIGPQADIWSSVEISFGRKKTRAAALSPAPARGVTPSPRLTTACPAPLERG
jgi:hypothetical protein